MLTLDDFDYRLPQQFIAQSPCQPRDSARLMVLHRQTGHLSHHIFRDLPHLLPPNYTLVVNNTKVFPARLFAHKPTGGKVEILLLEKKSSTTFLTITKPGLKIGQKLLFSNSDLQAICLAQNDRLRTLRFSQTDPQLTQTLARIGHIPTPPYIKNMLANPHLYQTIYAKKGFSAAAPTAGLHFTPSLLHTLQNTHGLYELTLNVGLGTFLPVQTSNISHHHMHREFYTITASLAQTLNHLKKTGHKIVAVGTTTLRALESAVDKNNQLQAKSEYTDIFIYPPYRFRFVDALITNFHLPKSTLLMLVAAFTSYPNTSHYFKNYHSSLIGQAYETAKHLGYRFFSFGDAMLIL